MRRTGIALLVAATAAAAGCGGGGGSSSSGSSTAALSPAQFRSQVRQLCSQAQKQVNSVPEPKSAAGVVPYINKTLAVAKPYVNKLAALNPPAQFSSQFQQVVSLNRRELALLSKTKSQLAGNANPAQVIATMQKEANSLSSSEDAKWRQMGVPKCAS